MKPANRASTYNFLLGCTILLLVFASINCSSKEDEDKKGQTPPAQAAKEELNRLNKEISELKKALAEKTDAEEQHAFKEELERLRQENEQLKEALLQAQARKEQTDVSQQAERLKQEIDNLKKALAEKTATTEQGLTHYEDRDQVDTIIARFDSARTAERKIQLIESLGELYFENDSSVISLVAKALDDPNLQVGRAAIELLQDYETPEILPVIEKALNSDDEEIREQALMPLSVINDSRAANLLVKALDDTAESVRTTALEVAEEQNDDIMLSVMTEAINSPYDDVKYSIASTLEDRGDHAAVDVLIEGLKSQDPDFHDEINEALDFLIEEEFENYEDALYWWDENRDKFDEELFRIDDE